MGRTLDHVQSAKEAQILDLIRQGIRKSGLNDDGLRLLEPVTIVDFPAVEAFSAKEKFAIGTQDGVIIGRIGDSFRKHFLSKAEREVPPQRLRIHRLRQSYRDGRIIKELGGEEVVETNLATVFEAMKKQGAGQTGDLLVNGWANIFYVRNDEGTLWAVYCCWFVGRDYWDVEASPVVYPNDWSADDQVFSR